MKHGTVDTYVCTFLKYACVLNIGVYLYTIYLLTTAPSCKHLEMLFHVTSIFYCFVLILYSSISIDVYSYSIYPLTTAPSCKLWKYYFMLSVSFITWYWYRSHLPSHQVNISSHVWYQERIFLIAVTLSVTQLLGFCYNVQFNSKWKNSGVYWDGTRYTVISRSIAKFFYM